jgi:hypothetical protein
LQLYVFVNPCYDDDTHHTSYDQEHNDVTLLFGIVVAVWEFAPAADESMAKVEVVRRQKAGHGAAASFTPRECI